MAQFLLIQNRPEKDAADAEYESFCSLGGIESQNLDRLDIAVDVMPSADISKYKAIIMGGGPSCFAYDEDHKSDLQKRMEPWLFEVFDQICEQDKPFLGVCLGVGLFATRLGGKMSFEISETIGVTEITLTDNGRLDPVMENIPDQFLAVVGHKEGMAIQPPNVEVLATSSVCPQVLRYKSNIYACQYHPELDADATEKRLRIYQYHGYCDPAEVDTISAAMIPQDLSAAPVLLSNFIKKYSV